MLRNFADWCVGYCILVILNEVLSLNAQESLGGNGVGTEITILNEVLSLNAQEYTPLRPV